MTLDGVDKESFSSAEVQLAFRQKIADQLGVDVLLISLGNITETRRRRRLAGGITFTIVIMASPASEPAPAPAPVNGSASNYAAVTPSPVPAISFADLLQSSGALKSMITQVYQAQSLPVPNLTVTASAPTTETLIVELTCPAGKFFPPGTNTSDCLLCPKGRFQDIAGAEICKTRAPCVPGTYVSREDQAGNAQEPDLCANCPAGKLSLYSDSLNCMLCPVGEYQPQSGKVFCETCPPHATTDGGAISADNCKCAKGFFMVVGGTWVKGTWTAITRPECRECVAGASCETAGLTTATLQTKPGFWRAGSQTIHFDSVACEASTCAGGNFMLLPLPQNGTRALRSLTSPSDAQCANGQTGLMCSSCDTEQHFARYLGAQCIRCADSHAAAAVEIVGSLAALVVVIWLAYKRAAKPLYIRIRKTMTPVQMRKALYKRQMKVKILLAYVQVASRIQGTFRLHFPPAVKAFLMQLKLLEFFGKLAFIRPLT
jgi:hypothetical protein